MKKPDKWSIIGIIISLLLFGFGNIFKDYILILSIAAIILAIVLIIYEFIPYNIETIISYLRMVKKMMVRLKPQFSINGGSNRQRNTLLGLITLLSLFIIMGNSIWNIKEYVDFQPHQGIIAAGDNFTVALKENGEVVCVGNNDDINVENWKNVKQIAAYKDHVLGLFEDGTVAFTGVSSSGNDNVETWTNIVQVAACYQGSIGLKADGTVIYAGFDGANANACEKWNDIKRILGGEDLIAALTNSGDIVTAGYTRGINNYISTQTYSLPNDVNDNSTQTYSLPNDVVEGFVANSTVFWVYSDGHVGAQGFDWVGEDTISGWSNIVAISGGDEHTVGLRRDGTVVAMGSNRHGQCNVQDWTDIIAIYCGQYHTIGLRSDGTLVATGSNQDGQCNVKGIHLW